MLEVFPQCVRSGYCCKKAPCVFGSVTSDTDQSCKFLKGDALGEYSCGKYEEIHAIDQTYFGAGCSSSLNSDRQLVLEGRTNEDNNN